MNLVEFLLEIKELHVFVDLNGGNLKVKGDREALTPELKRKLASYKDRIIECYQQLNIQSNNQIAPTAFSQLRLWFIDQLESGSVHYNMPSATRLYGDISLAAINQAFNAIIERHESLRTVFISYSGVPYQIIKAHHQTEESICDISHLPDSEKQEKLKQLCRQESHKPFKLDSDLMIRWKIIKLSEKEHVLLRTLHHIASDGWSLGIIAKEFSTLYQSFKNGQQNTLPPLAIQFADYAHWQRQWLKGDVLESQLKYWLDSLKGIPAVHSLPLDKPRPIAQTHQGRNHGSRIDRETTKALTELCLQQGATLFMGLHAIFALLLSRYSGEDDIVIGTPIANREQPDVAPLNGFFLNTLVFRSDLSVVENFQQLLEQSKTTAMGAYAHQQVPFEQLVNLLNVEQSLSYSPMFQIMMILQNNESSNSQLSQIESKSVNTGFTFAKFDITLNITQANEELWLGWNFNTDLFDISTIWRLAANFEVLLKSALAKPYEPLKLLRLLNAEEYQYCTSTMNRGALNYAKHCCIQTIFEDRVKEAPDAIAMVENSNQITYQQLNRLANQLAHFLINRNLVTHTIVAVCLPRLFDRFIAVMAILKAGGAYLPIDPKYPQNRIRYMCDDAKCQLLITDSSNFEGLIKQLTYVYLDDPTTRQLIAEESKNNLATAKLGISANDLAYVMYTSGTTGQPKGVKVTHRNLHAYYSSASTIYELNSRDRILQFSSFSFDICVEEMYCAFLTGATLVLRDEAQLMADRAFWKTIVTQSLTIVSLPTAFWHEVCHQLDDSVLNTNDLRLTIIGGESASANLLQKWNDKVSTKVKTLNTYGPTETTVIATYCDLSEVNLTYGNIPIGKPIPNVQCFVLSHDRQVCPVGVLGELYIGGETVSQGYLNNPKATKQSFIKQAFNEGRGQTLYKTGDMARVLLDGNIEFNGRIDDQVKINGYRVELGEVEQQIENCCGVKSCIVLAVEKEPGLKLIVAYVVAEKISINDKMTFKINLKEKLQQQLADFMLPSAYMILDAWPLTENGKINKSALPQPDANTFQGEYIAPSTETERKLVAIWSKLLAMEEGEISTTANFFKLGGHSLLAVRLAAEIRKQFKQEVDVKTAFQQSEIKSLGLLLDSRIKRKQVSDRLLSESGGDTEELEW